MTASAMYGDLAEREAFVAGWLIERERDLSERRRHWSEPFLPGINSSLDDLDG